MIKSKRTRVVVALSALGLAGWNGEEPADSAASTPPAASAAEAEKLILFKNGRLVSGVIRVDEEEDKIFVTPKGGAITVNYPRGLIERVFSSITELHAYKRDQVPDDDPDEQLKLAQWCLTNGLQDQAKFHLGLILKLDPKHQQAFAMRESMHAEEVRIARRQQMDSQVQQTSGEVVDPRPAALDEAVIRRARRGMGISDVPEIFDLPRAAALKRAQEFAEYVHPVLQAYCARCHDERYDGSFQMIHLKNKADRTPAALRANLDSALRLVDRENPGTSELLAASLRPHSRDGKTRPIFASSNDRAYQILAEWVNRLRAKPTPNALAGSAPSRAAADAGEDFAVDRTRISRSAVSVDPIQGEGGATAPPPTIRNFQSPDMRYTPGEGWKEDEGGGADAPLPFAVSGVMPRLPADADADDEDEPPIPRPVARRPVAPDADPAAPRPLPMPPPEEDDDIPPPRSTKPAKPVKINPDLLMKALQQKNAGGQ